MDIAVEDQAYEAPLGVDERAAGITANDVVVGRQIKARLRIELVFHREPAVRNLERLLARGALKQPRRMGKRLDFLRAFAPALHGAEVKPQCERGIWRHLGAVHLEAHARDLLRRGLHRGFRLVLLLLAHGARLHINRPRQLDHRIVGGVDGGLAAFPQLLAHRGIRQMRTVHHTRRERIRGILRQQLPDYGGIRSQPLAHALERKRQGELLKLRVHRHGSQQAALHARHGGLAVLGQTVDVGLGALGRSSHQRARVGEQAAVESRSLFQERVGQRQFARPHLGARDIGPRVAGAGERGIGSDLGAQRHFLIALALHQPVIKQRVELVAAHLDGILQAVQRVLHDAVRLGAGLAVLDVTAAQLRRAQQPARQFHVTQQAQLRHGQQALRGAGVSGHEYEFACLRSLGAYRQEFRRGRGLAIRPVGAQHRHVEAPARELEVIRITAEGGNAALGREHQPHVVIAVVLVEPVLPALVQVHRFALERATGGLLARVLAGLLELREGLLAGVVRGLVIQALDRRHHLRRDVFRAHEDIRDLGGALQLLITRARQEAGAHQVLLAGGVLVQTRLGTVVVGEDQPLGGYKGSRAVRQADRRGANAIKPGGVNVSAVFLLEKLAWKIMHGPHAGVAEYRWRRQ